MKNIYNGGGASQYSIIQGPKGDRGENGVDGKDGIDGKDGKDGKDGIDGISIIGPQGIQGPPGVGLQGDTGPQGPIGPSILSSCTDVQFSPLNNNDILTYSNVSSKWINQEYFGLYKSTASVTASTITPDYNIIYYSNSGTFNMPASVQGKCIKIINIGGTTCTINFTGRILWHITNLFNITISTTDACDIEFEGSFGGNNWQIKSMTGRWTNSLTGKFLTQSSSNLEDLRNVSILSPLNNQYLVYNGIQWESRTVATPNNNLSGLNDVTISNLNHFDRLVYNGVNNKWENWPSQTMCFNSASNITLGRFLTFTGLQTAENRAQIVIAGRRYLQNFIMTLQNPPTPSGTISVQVRKNTATLLTLTISGNNTTTTSSTLVLFNDGEYLSLLISGTGLPVVGNLWFSFTC